MTLLSRIACLALLSLAALRPAHSATLKLGYSDWPGYTLLEVANQKGWFKAAGIDLELVWFDYNASIDAFAAGKIDGDCIVASDAVVTGASGSKSKFITLIDFSEGSDMIIGKPGIASIKDLKGQKVGVELTLVEHMLLFEALKRNGLSQKDITLVPTPTNNTPQTLASGQVAAVSAWYPISGQALTQVPGSKRLFTSADAKGLIYDVIAVNPASLAANHDAWAKLAGIYYKCVAYLKDPSTRDDAIRIMAAKVGANAADYAKNVPGTHFLTLAEAKAAYRKGPGLESIYGSVAFCDKFNLENGVYKEAQNPDDYVSPGIVMAMK